MDTFVIVFIIVGILFIVGVLAILGYFSSRWPRGALPIGAFVVLVAVNIVHSESRVGEAVLVLIQLTSFAALILGVVDLVRRRKPREEPK